MVQDTASRNLLISNQGYVRVRARFGLGEFILDVS